MKNENYDDIKAMFDSDGVTLPEALYKENMVGKIKERESNPASSVRPLKPKRKAAAILSAAAVFALIVTAVAVSSRTGKPSVSEVPTIPENTVASPAGSETTADTQAQATTGSKPTTTRKETSNEEPEVPDDSGLISFQSEEEFIKFLNSKIKTGVQTTVSNAESNMGGTGSGTIKNYAAAPMAPGDTADGAVVQESIASGAATSSQTNTQVDGVDEADIIKNDGRYIYVITESARLCVVDTESMKTVFSQELTAINDGTNYMANEMYLTGNRLIVLGSQNKKFEQIEVNESETTQAGDTVFSTARYFPFNYETVIRIFDLSDKNNISLVTSFTQDGTYSDSRLVDGYAYIITHYNINSPGGIEKGAVPSVKNEKITCDCLWAERNCNDYTGQTVISGFSVSENDPTVSKVSVVGYTNEIYCSKNTLYLLSSNWYKESGGMDIYSFSLKDGKIEKKATGNVPGVVKDNYSVDEKDGCLRVATTDYNYKTDKDISSVYVLDEKLDIVGKLTDIAPDEQVKSVRFIGNIAYIVTFRNTDPLFAVDLSDPKNPTILGQVKLPGFSEYLHPLGDNLLVGIGYDGDDDSADFQSLKITLFDISDPLKPTVKDSLVYENTSSRVLYEPKSFIMGQSGSDFYIPTSKEKEHYDILGEWYKSTYTLTYLHISAENGTLSVLTSYTVPKKFDTDHASYDIFTGAYIGENFYAVVDTAIYRFTLSDGTKTAEASLKKAG